MRIEYDLIKDYNKCFNEALGVAINKRKILKNKHIYTYTGYGFRYLLITLIFIGFDLLFFAIDKNGIFTKFLTCLIFLIMLFIIVYFIVYFIRLHYSKKRQIKGYFDINERGLINYTFDSIEILFLWDKIKTIVVHKNSIIILTDTPIYFFVNKELEKVIIDNFKKYKNSINIVYL